MDVAIEREESGRGDDVATRHLQNSPTMTSNPRGHRNDSPEPDNPAVSARSVADAPKDGGSELWTEGEAQMSRLLAAFREEFSAFREGEEKRVDRLEKAIKGLKPSEVQIDPTTNFWTAYKKVADDHDDSLVSKYVGDLDTSLIFAGLFSGVTTAFIIQIIPTLQPNPSDLTNALLLRILQQNASFNGSDPLAPVSGVPPSLATAQSILFASLAITLLVAFIAVLGKQWILYYSKAAILGNIVDRGKEHYGKLRGVQKWGLPFVIELLPVLLQSALLLFAIALVVYFWDLEPSAARVVLVVTGIGFAFYASIAVVATFWSDFPFQTPLSVLLPKALLWLKGSAVLPRGWLRRGLRRQASAVLLLVEQAAEHHRLISPIGRLCKILFGGEIAPEPVIENVYDKHYSMELSNPAFWRHDPLFPPIPKDTDITVSAGVWLLENSIDSLAATSVAAAFPQFQWPSHHYSITTLIRLSDAYAEHIQAAKFDESTRRKAVQCAATYYVIFHTWLIWSASKCHEAEVEKLPPSLPSDLLLYKHNDKWGGDDIFEHLLHIKDRSEPITSARFLSYIAPYWFCGDSDAGVRFRSKNLPTLRELIITLERSKPLDARTLTDCFLCAGAAMDLPLHPGDLIRVDKSKYIVQTFKTVVDHIHRIATALSRRHRYAAEALDILLVLLRHTNLPLVDSVWINELLKHAAEVDMADETFIMFLRLSARRVEAVTVVDMEEEEDYIVIQSRKTDPRSLGRTMMSNTPSPDDTLFDKIMKNIQSRVGDENGWRDDAVYGGLVAIAGIRHLEASHFRDDVLQTLCEAMQSDRPLRVRKAAYDAMLVTRDQWIESEKLRQKLQDIGLFRLLYNTVVDIARSDYQQSFLMITEVLSEDEHWHSYLRETMEIWLSLCHQGPDHTVLILKNVGGMLHAWWNASNALPLDEHLQKLVEDEWAGVPARPVHLLSVDRLEPLVEVTEQFRELLLDSSYRRAVLARVEGVIPGLEQRRDDGYGGPGEDVRGIINDLVETLQTPSRRPSRLLAQ